MMYLWDIPNNYPEKLIGRYDKALSPDRFILKQGKPVDLIEVFVKFEAKAEKLQKYDCLANNAMVPLVSPRVANLLSNLAPDEVQLIRTHIIASDIEITDYKIVVATKKIKSIDHNASEYICVPGSQTIMKFKKLRCLEGCLGKLNIARDAEYLSNLIVSEPLRNALVELRGQGLGLYRPEEMSW